MTFNEEALQLQVTMALDFITSRDYVELQSLNTVHDDRQISKSSLYDMHKEQFSNGVTNERHMVSIIDILGGIDKIESMCPCRKVSSVNVQFPPFQDQRVEYIVRDDDTFLHYCFETTTANKIIKFIYNKYIIALLVLVHFGWWVWWVLIYKTWMDQTNYTLSSYFRYKAIHLPFICVWQICIILSVNKKILIMVASSFLFWFKIGLVIKYSVIWLVLVYSYNMYDYQGHEMGNAFFVLHLTLLVIMVCIMDGFHIDRKYKIIAILINVTLLAANTYTDGQYSPLDSVVTLGQINISLHANLIDSEITLILFLLKQNVIIGSFCSMSFDSKISHNLNS